MKTPTFEILTWQSAAGVEESEMINAMTKFGEIVKRLQGFLYQSLYKKEDGQWVCIYFWETAQEAHASNEAVANTTEFSELMRLIQEGSVTMEVLSTLQHSGIIQFS